MKPVRLQSILHVICPNRTLFPVAWRLICFFICLNLTSTASSLDTRFFSTILDADFGLNRTKIYDIKVDQAGYVWLATERGVIRYDRKNFVEIGTGDSVLDNATCKKLCLTSTRLYCAFPQVGFAAINLTDYSDTYSERVNICDISAAHEKDYAVLFADGKVESRNNLKTNAAIDFHWARSGILQHHKGQLFLSLPEKGLYLLDPITLNVIKTDDFIPTGFHASFEEIGSDLVLLDNNTYYLLKDDHWERRSRWKGLTGVETMTCLIGLTDGGLLFNRFQKEVVQKRIDRSITVLATDSISNLEFYSLAQAGRSYFAGTNQGLVLIRPEPAQPEIINDNLPENDQDIRVRRKILEVSDDELLLFGFPYTYRYKAGKLSRLSNVSRSAIDAVLWNDSAFYTTEGSGLEAVSLKTGQLRSVVQPGALEKKGFCYGLLFEPATSSLLIGHFGKVTRYSLKDGSTSQYPIPLAKAAVRKILYSKAHNRYYIGTTAGLVVTDASFGVIQTSDAAQGLGGNLISDLYLDEKNNKVYVAHDKGVDVVDASTGKQLHSLFQDHPQQPRCVSITPDKQGRLWIGTYSGVIAYDPVTGDFLRLNRNNGLINNEFNYASATCISSDGRIVLGGLNCYDIIRPENFNFGSSDQKGIISGYHLFSKKDTTFEEQLTDKPIRFNIDDDYLRIYLRTNGADPEAIRAFEYSFNDGPWLSTGGKSYVDVFHFDPGKYKVEFRSYDEFGNLIRFPAIMIAAVTPFYEARWFIWSLIGLAMLALLLYATSWYRYHKRMVALRNKIAMDLHDEVGSLLTYALYQSKTSSGVSGNKDLQHNLREAIYALRVYVKSIDERKRSIEQLMDGLRDFIDSSFPKNSFEVTFESHCIDGLMLPAELFRDIKLCFIELCTNILKHSDGNCVTILLDATEEALMLRIIDNGTGKGATDSFDSGGSGSVNIQKRAARYGGKLTYSQPRHTAGLQAEVFFNIQNQKP
ncbi:MAG: two-component regulator propeller domain-containing protein [Bacteroidota bacterium]